jgi:uncharacterized protein (DUF1810 family)
VNDPHDLQRFVEAQSPVYGNVRAELAAGAKRSHWMWFVFPQLRGLGKSEMARHYGIGSREEAEAYVRHPLLGARLKECTELALRVPEKTANEIFGSPDDLKFRSSMTLFARVAPEEMLFDRVLARFFGGVGDENTIRML